MVSVIVPVYNAEAYIVRCIGSILNQSFQDIELIVINDGSKDRTLSLVQEFAENDRRIRIISQENQGVATARNNGLLNATGDYILYVDADDWLEPDALESLLMHMGADVDIVCCASDHAESPETVQREDRVELETWDHDAQLLEFLKHQRMAGMLWNKLIRRSVTNGVSFNAKTGYGEDAEFLWQVLQNTRKMIISNQVLYHHVLESDSISHLSYSEKKYTAIPMWEKINADVAEKYPQWINTAKVSLTCAAVYGYYEARQCGYQNKLHMKHMRKIARKNIVLFLQTGYLSLKYKLFALAVCVGY